MRRRRRRRASKGNKVGNHNETRKLGESEV